jgi:hypothetical protein
MAAMNSDLHRACRRMLRAAERGEDSSFEFTVMIVPMVLMMSLIAFATLVRSSQVPAWTAASECARAAIATLDEDIGVAQGRRAAMNSLSGNFIRATGLTVNVAYGTWDRGSTVTCRVDYNIDLDGVVLMDSFFPGNKVPMSAEVSLRVERFKSRWSS